MTVTVQKVSVMDSLVAANFANADIIYIVHDSGGGILKSYQTTWGDIVTAMKAIIDQTKVDVNNVSGAYTYLSTDAGKVVRHNDASATTATIDKHGNNVLHDFAVKQVLTMRQIGAGQLTITTPSGSGVAINVPNGFVAKTRTQGSVIMAHQVATDVWDLTGDLATT